ncbi:MFS transporter [Gloeobacter kilaueensis]|uniref:Major facilitator transporter n=1 Tax=Gloeobacter kilaueensis (strain ATCC BAA-2537 / CCAP 1431/1 / ULC 316 / JS1) TaxID=1183438 RepID=U5QJE3_GLOK1|nr:MFS transporter [Gloeobacter kilaueensis]AGY57739.1 major facilitator transporter [Gloeobacter kilaueensis JS1]
MSAPSVRWLPVFGLGILHSAITLCWVFYNLYLPQLLGAFGFAASAVAMLLVVEGLLGAVLEPVMGALSDRTRRNILTRFSLIAAGVIGASLLFVGIPLFSLSGSTALRWVLPVLLVAWALAMTVFRSPALALLGQYAAPASLPLAAGVLGTLGSLAAASGPATRAYWLSLGPLATFTVGSLALLAGLLVLRWLDNRLPLEMLPTTGPSQSSMPLWLLFVTGLGVTFGFRLLLDGLSRHLTLTGAEPPGGLIPVLFAATALASLPCGALAMRLSGNWLMILGLLAMATFSGLSASITSPTASLGVALALGLAFSFVNNGLFPFALDHVAPERAGLALGLYFGGTALAICLFNAAGPFWKTVAPASCLLFALLSFLFAAACVAAASLLSFLTERSFASQRT